MKQCISEVQNSPLPSVAGDYFLGRIKYTFVHEYRVRNKNSKKGIDRGKDFIIILLWETGKEALGSSPLKRL